MSPFLAKIGEDGGGKLICKRITKQKKNYLFMELGNETNNRNQHRSGMKGTET